ncbi:hypothetical protein SLEP1_g32484 [Rubroshorea leprosula]|uniref:AAA+ ATPase domain-containing protein n=1 Tax=Rubroshorea leprosula TaxID=152421 RepID=A0AAV5KDH2_9ROSI|nr:hypothetical protein SLEP1_g32484 [Rubroshorea leprosula]
MAGCCIAGGTAVGTAVVGKCTEILVDPLLKLIWNRITRVFKSGSNVKTLKEKAGKLVAEKQRVLQFTEAAGRRGEEAALNVMNWLTSAEEYIGELEKLGDDEDKAKKKCFAGLCPNPRARYQISKKVEEYLEAVAPLLEEAAGSGFLVSYRLPPKEISTGAAEGFEQFESRMPTLNRVMEALRSASVDKIGIHGLPGVGKTMLAKEVARQAGEEQLFDVIVMASVKKDPDLKKIQGEIADKLGLQLQGETEFGRAIQLKGYLNKKKILVILDDIWARLDLGELGIPFENKKSEASSTEEEQMLCKKKTEEEQMQCKILLTSRDLNVLSRMGTRENIEVGTLQAEEAWALLKRIVGDEVENSELLPTAKEIVGKCAGLPLAVEAVAKALKGKDAHVWRDALVQLKRPCPESFTGISANVYSAIELSYNHLGGKELQQTFLLCCLLGHNSSIEDLLMYGIGLDLFGNVKTTGEARDRVLTLVSNLKSSSLLLDGRHNGLFDMHDIVVPRLEKLSLTGNDIEMIRNRPFPENIFFHVKSLEVRCIHGDSAALPIIFLERFCNLQKLQIGCSEIKELFPPVASTDSSEKDVGGRLHKITKLELNQLLKLNYIWKQGPPSNLLFQNVKSLKVLSCDSLISLSESTASFQNLTTLSVKSCEGLINLFSFATAQSLVQLQSMSVEKCHSLTEIVGGEGVGLADVIVFSKLKVLKLKGLTRLASFCSTNFTNFTFNLPLLEALMVVQCPKFETFCRGVVRTPSLQRIFTQQDDEGREVVELNRTINQLYKEKVGYAGLQDLNLSEFPWLMEVWNKNPKQFLDFTCLRVLKICNCGNLRYLLTPSLALSLADLRTLEVQNCEMIEKIITEEGSTEVAENKMIFPLLVTINLGSCFNLTSFCSASYGLEFPSLSDMRIIDCPKMVTFPTTFSTVQVKEAVEGGSKERTGKQYADIPTEPFFSGQVEFSSFLRLVLSLVNMQQIFNRQLSSAMSSVIQSVGYLTVFGCDNLKYLFTSSMIKSLGQLVLLAIRDCKMMKEIIVTEGIAEEEEMMFLRNLETLRLEGLPKLTGFCHRNCSVFPSLTELALVKCPLLETFISSPTIGDTSHVTTSKNGENACKSPLFDAKVAFPCLEELTITGLENLRIIWHHQPPADPFRKLKSLVIGNCGKLLTIGSSDILERLCKSLEVLKVIACDSLEKIFELGEVSIESRTKSLGQLKRLEIRDCKMMKEIIVTEGIAEEEEMMFLRNLEILRLEGLPRLTGFCHRNCSEFPSLTKLALVKCPLLETFISSPTIGDTSHVRTSKNGENAYKSPLFDAKVAFPCLEELTIIGLENLRIIWHHQPHAASFHNLKSLVIGHCGKLLTVGSSDILGKLCKSLEVLKVIACHSVEMIFALGEVYIEKSHGAQDTMLSELNIENLSRLKHVWNKDPRDILSFQNLQSVRAVGHPNVQNMFPASVAMGFQQLEEFGLVNRGIETERVVAFEGEEAARRFVVPRLKALSLTSDDIAMICNGEFPEDLFSNVKVLRLLCYHNEPADFPSRFIERFFNLEKLFIGCSSFKELFPSVASIDCQEKDVGWQLRIRKLTLDALCNLKYIWNQGSPSDLPNLKSLKVQRCDCLISLSESTASFRNLTTLFVTSCQKLRNLFSSTTVQSLVHLQTMRIEQCKLLSEIVRDEGDELGHVIVFSKLKVLELKCLTRLASFCSANFTFELPLLKELIVVQCPNFETFCHGVVRTPNPQRIQLTEEVNLWHSVELNNTINQLYKKMVRIEPFTVSNCNFLAGPLLILSSTAR